MKRVLRQILIWVAVVAFAVSIGYAARDLPRHLSGESGLPPPMVSSDIPASSDYSVDSILSLAPFGRAAEEQAPVVNTGEPSLGLTLRGVVIAAGAPSKAIIAGSSGAAQTYSAGDEVTPNATLREVHGDHVVLDIEGSEQSLAFPNADRSIAQPPVEEESSEGVAELLANWYEQAKEDPGTVLDSLGLEVGESGYVVTDQLSDDLRQAGFVAGDVVVKVNGQQVGNIQTDLDLFNAALASGHAKLDVIRNGQPLVMSFSLR